MIRLRFFTLRLPFGPYLHYAKGRKLGESRLSYDSGLLHYDVKKRIVGTTVLSFFSEPNHYDPHGRCTGYSRPGTFLKILHYNAKGQPIGHTYHFLGLFFLHRFVGP